MDTSNKFDFQDKRNPGPVPAHRHINPNGSIGGWVADTAYVAPTVRVSLNARIFGYARVCDNAQILGSAKVYDHAQVLDNAILCDNTQIYSHAIIYNNAHITKNTKVCGYSSMENGILVYRYARVYGSMYLNRVGGLTCTSYAEFSNHKFVIDIRGSVGYEDKITIKAYTKEDVSHNVYKLSEFQNYIESNQYDKLYVSELEDIKYLYKVYLNTLL